jgi:hypothetical protein
MAAHLSMGGTSRLQKGYFAPAKAEKAGGK